MTHASLPRMYRLNEISRSTGISVRTLRALCRDGRLPSVRLGKYRYVREDDLRDALDQQRPAAR